MYIFYKKKHIPYFGRGEFAQPTLKNQHLVHGTQVTVECPKRELPRHDVTISGQAKSK